MSKFFSISFSFFSTLFIILGITSPSTGNALEDQKILQTAQQQIELGNLSHATRLLDKVEDSPYKRALYANIAARVGDYDGAITLYDTLIDQFQDQSRYRLLWNYIQTLRERQEYFQWQLEQEYDPLVQKSFKSLIESDQALALNLSRHYREDLEIAILLWELSRDEIDINALRTKILALKNSGSKVESLLAINDTDAAINVAQSLNEPLFLSWAYGESGEEQLRKGKVQEAIASLNLARIAANQARDFLALARWQGNLGKAYVSQGNLEKAKLNYEVAIKAIEKVRQTVSGYRVNPMMLKEIEPILRDYLALLLNNPEQEDLKKAVEIQKLSTLSELDSYFKTLCHLDVKLISAIKSDVVYIYTIILENRSYLIVQTEAGYFLETINISKFDLERQLYHWRLALADPSKDAYIENGRKLYDLLLRPLEPLIVGKKKLVFVQDGFLRTVPMAALIDGDEFLVERYDISYSLGFKLQEPNQRIRTALVAGSSTTSTEVLPSITQEIASIGKILQADILLDGNLSEQSFSNKLQEQSYGVVHIATRNEITPDINQSRFSLGKQDISLLEFERLLRDRHGDITFLNLAGCDTATGNSVAILGLTGIGLRTGIVNTVGSLWGIPDETTTDFMLRFYQALNHTGNYSSSLRQAQLREIKNPLSRPYSWAGFISLTNE